MTGFRKRTMMTSINERVYRGAILKNLKYFAGFILGVLLAVCSFKLSSYAVEPPTITYDEVNQEIIIEGIPMCENPYHYQLRTSMYYEGGELVESSCMGPCEATYDVPEHSAYIYSWHDHEGILPGDGYYTIYAWIRKDTLPTPTTTEATENSEKVSLTFYYTKTDHSGDWGSGLKDVEIDDGVVTYDALNSIIGSERNAVVNGNGYSWTINGADLQDATTDDVDLSISFDEEKVSDEEAQSLFPNMTLVKWFDVASEGPLNFEAKLQLLLDTTFAGKYGNLFYVDEDGYLFVNSELIAEDGSVIYAFDHLSEYVLAVSDEPYDTSVNPEKIPFPVEEEAVSENEIEAVSDNLLIASAEEAEVEAETISDEVSEDSEVGRSLSASAIVLILVAVVAVAGVAIVIVRKTNS